MYLMLTSKARVVVQAVTDVTLIFSISSFLVLKDCLYVPKSRTNLIYISSLYKLNYLFLVNNKHVFIKLNNSFICSQSLIDSLYHISPLSIFPTNENYHISRKRKEPSTNKKTNLALIPRSYYWNKIQGLVKSGILPSLIIKDLSVYESYI